MKLVMENNGHMTINDNSIEAKKILQGFGYYFDKGILKIKTTKEDYDIADFEKKITTGVVNNKEIQDFLREMVKIYKKIKFNID